MTVPVLLALILADDGPHWFDNKHGYLARDGYPDGHGERSYYKAIAWMPIPTYPEVQQ